MNRPSKARIVAGPCTWALGYAALGGTALAGVALAGVALAGDGTPRDLAPDALAKARRLVAAYPAALDRVAGNAIAWKDGKRMTFDDGLGQKPFATLMNDPDLEDQFTFAYRAGALKLRPATYVDPGAAGAYNCRQIARTGRLSMHAYGAAIDINVKHADYWRWAGPDNGNQNRHRNKLPFEIVRIFEKHGFIWGGKWYHYDTMHFEYRPELIDPALAPPNRP